MSVGIDFFFSWTARVIVPASKKNIFSPQCQGRPLGPPAFYTMHIRDSFLGDKAVTV
jgi:hypothetical protein